MENINLYRLMSKLSARPEVRTADIVSWEGTIKTVMRDGTVVAIGVQDEYPAVAVHHIRQRRGLPQQGASDRRLVLRLRGRPRLQERRGQHHQGGVLTHGYCRFRQRP